MLNSTLLLHAFFKVAVIMHIESFYVGIVFFYFKQILWEY